MFLILYLLILYPHIKYLFLHCSVVFYQSNALEVILQHFLLKGTRHVCLLYVHKVPSMFLQALIRQSWHHYAYTACSSRIIPTQPHLSPLAMSAIVNYSLSLPAMLALLICVLQFRTLTVS